MSQTQNSITNAEFQDSLRTLLRDTRGLTENVDAGLAKFKRDAYPHSDAALQMLVDEGYLDRDYHPTAEKGGVLENIYQVFFSHMGDGERVMPDGVRVVWDALCSCYVLPPEEGGRPSQAHV